MALNISEYIAPHLNGNHDADTQKQLNKSQLVEDPIAIIYDHEQEVTLAKEFGLIVIGAIILTASLLWRDFLAALGESIFPSYRGLLGKFIYVCIITILLIFLAIILRNVFVLNNPHFYKNLKSSKKSGTN